MKKTALVLVIIILVLSLCACGGSDKKALCDGVWVYDYYSSLTPTRSLTIYNFSRNGTFSYTKLTSMFGSNPNTTKYTGKYSINTSDRQINLTYDKDKNGEPYQLPETIPYYINEYNHEFIFKVNASGTSDYYNKSSEKEAIDFFKSLNGN